MKDLLVATAFFVGASLGNSSALAQNAALGDIEITQAWAPAMPGPKLTNSAVWFTGPAYRSGL
jgi:hypothetical protein